MLLLYNVSENFPNRLAVNIEAIRGISKVNLRLQLMITVAFAGVYHCV